MGLPSQTVRQSTSRQVRGTLSRRIASASSTGAFTVRGGDFPIGAGRGGGHVDDRPASPRMPDESFRAETHLAHLRLSGQAHEHDSQPMGKLYELVRRTSSGVNHITGAMG